VSELPTGAYAPDDSSGTSTSKTRQVAEESKQAAGQAVSDVKGTAAEQAQRVGSQAKTEVRNVVGDVRDKLGEQARTQNDRLVSTIRETADHLDEMRGDRAGTPAATVVTRVADSGRQLADYLDRHGPEGVLQEVQDFARRRPGAFLATALAAGFVVGRLGKTVAKADAQAGKPSTDSFSSGTAGTPRTAVSTPDPGYYPPVTTPPVADYATTTGAGAGYESVDYPTTTSTEYASTGTGRPVVVAEEYPVAGQEPLR
jgi:hypothetical protein